MDQMLDIFSKAQIAELALVCTDRGATRARHQRSTADHRRVDGRGSIPSAHRQRALVDRTVMDRHHQESEFEELQARV